MRSPTGCAPSDVAPGAVVEVEVDGVPVVLWRTVSGTLVASDWRCPHQWSPLAVDGVVEGEELVCRAHAWRFGPDGRGTKVNLAGRRDAKADLAVHGVGVDDEGVWVDLGG